MKRSVRHLSLLLRRPCRLPRVLARSKRSWSGRKKSLAKQKQTTCNYCATDQMKKESVHSTKFQGSKIIEVRLCAAGSHLLFKAVQQNITFVTNGTSFTSQEDTNGGLRWGYARGRPSYVVKIPPTSFCIPLYIQEHTNFGACGKVTRFGHRNTFRSPLRNPKKTKRIRKIRSYGKKLQTFCRKETWPAQGLN
jgi:hypothetical protein